jgi:predicted DCC family thiol-disulfide oxidoreductase YuxK
MPLSDTNPADGSFSSPIIFYDGVCGLCNNFVAFLAKRDHRRTLRFAPLQGETYMTMFSERVDRPSSIVFWDGHERLRESSAVLASLTNLGFGWKLIARLCSFVPAKVRDRVYREVAARRYRIFGYSDVCDIPSSTVRQQLLP